MRKRKKMRPGSGHPNARGADRRPREPRNIRPRAFARQTSQSACGPRPVRGSSCSSPCLSADAALDCTRPPPRSRPPHKHRDHRLFGSGTSLLVCHLVLVCPGPSPSLALALALALALSLFLSLSLPLPLPLPLPKKPYPYPYVTPTPTLIRIMGMGLDLPDALEDCALSFAIRKVLGTSSPLILALTLSLTLTLTLTLELSPLPFVRY